MTTRERNQLLADCDQAILEALRVFQYGDSESESSELLELVYIKASGAIDLLKLPEGKIE